MSPKMANRMESIWPLCATSMAFYPFGGRDIQFLFHFLNYLFFKQYDNQCFKMTGRLGVDFNLMKKKKESKSTNNLFLAGLRLGVTHFNYNISNVLITDDLTKSSNKMTLAAELGVEVMSYEQIVDLFGLYE